MLTSYFITANLRKGQEKRKLGKGRTSFKLSVPQGVEKLDLGYREDTAEVPCQQEMFPLHLQKLN